MAPEDQKTPSQEFPDVMRRTYRALSPAERQDLDTVKRLGQDLHNCLETLGNSRELSLAKTKVEESVMWGVKHLTG